MALVARKCIRLLKYSTLTGLGCFFMLQIYLAFQLVLLDKNNSLLVDESTGNTDDLPVIFSALNKSVNSSMKVLQFRLNELEFTPLCNISSKEAISAVHRAKSQSCKQLIVNTTCAIDSDQFYPKVLPHMCPNVNHLFGSHIGCYEDNKRNRLLSGYYANYVEHNTPSHCLDVCLHAGFPYAGVQYSTECFCGDTIPPEEKRLEKYSCNMICPGNEKNMCGGYFAMDIYQTGLLKFTSIAPVLPTEDIQSNITIVFLLTLNGRALRQVQRLFNMLYSSSHYYYIHIDARQEYLYRELLPLEQKFGNVRVSKKRFSTIWGGASLLQMLLHSMTDFGNWKWDFVINLSESDYPIKPVVKLENFFNANRNMNFVKSHGREAQRFIKKQGLDKTFVECDTHMWRIGERKLPRGIVIDGGSDWIALSSKFVKFILGEKNALLDGLEVIFNHTLLPAESFFHTVLRNTPFCNTYVDNNLHVTNWKRKLGCRCQYRHVVDWCGCSPNDFKIEDWPRIEATLDRQLFFARKFEAIVNQEIIKRVEQSIGVNDHSLLDNVDSYWESIYNRKDAFDFKHDILLTHSKSIIRICKDIFNPTDVHLSIKNVEEIFSFHKNDIYKGNLILHTVKMNELYALIETWYKPSKHLNINLKSSYYDNVNIFKVSSDYDQKEEIFRNFAGILGPFSEPLLLYSFSGLIDSVQSKNYSIVWLDPTGVIADLAIISIDEFNLTNVVKMSVKSPLLPGIWKVALVDKNMWIVQTSFLITPTQYYNGKLLSPEQSEIVNGGSPRPYQLKNDVEIINFLPTSIETNNLKGEALYNSKKNGDELEIWIDSLTKLFYSILGSCIKADSNKLISRTYKSFSLDICEETSWSSLAPDPKGSIGRLNIKTGKLER